MPRAEFKRNAYGESAFGSWLEHAKTTTSSYQSFVLRPTPLKVIPPLSLSGQEVVVGAEASNKTLGDDTARQGQLHLVQMLKLWLSPLTSRRWIKSEK